MSIFRVEVFISSRSYHSSSAAAAGGIGPSSREISNNEVIFRCIADHIRWEVQRSVNVFYELILRLGVMSIPPLSPEQKYSADNIQALANQLLSVLEDKAWHCEKLLQFFDAKSLESPLFHVATHFLTQFMRSPRLLDQHPRTRLDSGSSTNSMETTKLNPDADPWKETPIALAVRDRLLKKLLHSSKNSMILSIDAVISDLQDFVKEGKDPNNHKRHLMKTATQIIAAMRPSPLELNIRRRVEEYVGALMRQIFDVYSFQCDLGSVNVNLYNDPICITAALPKDKIFGWNLKVMDALLRNGNISATSKLEPSDAHPKVLSESVRYDQQSDKVHFSVDCGLFVQIQLNDRRSIYMSNFIEKLNQRIGRNDLYKRSLILLKTWWKHEFSCRLHPVLAGAFNEESLSVLLCGVFELHGDTIYCPYGAFIWFLIEIFRWKPSEEVFTLQGRVSFYEMDGILHLKPTYMMADRYVTTECMSECGMIVHDKTNMSTYVLQAVPHNTYYVLHPFDNLNALENVKDIGHEVISQMANTALREAHAIVLRSEDFFRDDMELEEDSINLLFSHVQLRVWNTSSIPLDLKPSIDNWRKAKFMDLIIDGKLSESAVSEFCWSQLKAKCPINTRQLIGGLIEKSPHLRQMLEGHSDHMKDFFLKFLNVSIPMKESSESVEFLMVPCDDGNDYLFLNEELSLEEKRMLSTSSFVSYDIVVRMRNHSVQHGRHASSTLFTAGTAGSQINRDYSLPLALDAGHLQWKGSIEHDEQNLSVRSSISLPSPKGNSQDSALTATANIFGDSIHTVEFSCSNDTDKMRQQMLINPVPSPHAPSVAANMGGLSVSSDPDQAQPSIPVRRPTNELDDLASALLGTGLYDKITVGDECAPVRSSSFTLGAVGRPSHVHPLSAASPGRFSGRQTYGVTTTTPPGLSGPTAGELDSQRRNSSDHVNSWGGPVPFSEADSRSHGQASIGLDRHRGDLFHPLDIGHGRNRPNDIPPHYGSNEDLRYDARLNGSRHGFHGNSFSANHSWHGHPHPRPVAGGSQYHSRSYQPQHPHYDAPHPSTAPAYGSFPHDPNQGQRRQFRNLVYDTSRQFRPPHEREQG